MSCTLNLLCWRFLGDFFWYIMGWIPQGVNTDRNNHGKRFEDIEVPLVGEEVSVISRRVFDQAEDTAELMSGQQV